MRTRILLSLLVLPIGCSVLNSFDSVSDVQPDSGGGGGSGGKIQGDAGANPGGQAGADTGGSNTGGSGGSGGGSGGTVEAPDGLIVVQAQDMNDGGVLVLSALSPQTGKELARESGAFPGIAHEAERDIWFVLRSDSDLPSPIPGDTIRLEARRFDRRTNEWEVLTETPVEVPLPLDEKQVYAFNDRVVVLTYDSEALTGAQAVVFDTSDPDDIRQLKGSPVSLGELGAREFLGAVASPLALGGSVNVLRRNCGVDPCEIQLERVAALDEASLARTTTVGTVHVSTQTVAGTYNWAANKLTIAFPWLSESEMVGYIQQFNPITHSADAARYEFPPAAAPQLRLAVDACVGVGYVTSPLDVQAYGVPFTATSAPATLDIGHLGKTLVIEPYTRTLIAPFDSNTDFELTAFQLGTDKDQPELQQRFGNWAPPSKLKPLVVVTALPAAANEVCE